MIAPANTQLALIPELANDHADATDRTAPPPNPSAVVPVPPEHIQAAQLIALWLADNKSETTRQTYTAALEDFAGFAGTVTTAEAVARLLAAGKGPCTAVLTTYRSDLTDRRGLAPNSVNLRVAAIRSLLTKAYDLDLISWLVRVRGIKAATMRDTRGPGCDVVNQMYDQIRNRDDRKGARDRAIVRLLWDLGLRRMEIVGLDLEHLDIEKNCVWVRGKGKRERSWISLPDETRAALSAWLEARGPAPGPLFICLSNRDRGRRLTGHSIHRVVSLLGKKIGRRVWPHSFRHSAITTALDETGGNVRDVRLFSRHSDLATLVRYDDARQDRGGSVAQLVASKLR